ncbi:ABC transporter substrate-binding protein [Campylobacter sp. US33a]|uniref:ABC transporter substrate-binding protein n=1 Tax=Campylobacter sp. CCS1377 TaxID=3158229 RepID=A0AAU7E8D9_9BACT|nr:ABC transporter substrate-binding protein [Campylobacter sp. US33a]MCW1360357.1 ABC transporter substrate-binding protein [Campylobacter jejuni]TEY04470.1 ABC transporter substrate-binding protein [Campylobacter sp. US33a]
MKKILFLLMLFTSLYAKERLVVLDPASVEIIYMLNSEDKIAGIAKLEHSSIYPAEETQNLPSVGTFSNPSLEKIIALKPTLVILSSYSTGLEQSLKNLNIKTMYLKGERLNDLFTNINTLATLLDKEKEGQMLIEKTKRTLQDLKQDPINKSAIFLFSSNPLMAFSQNSLVADILELIGVKNLTPQSEIKRPIISSEFLIKQNPDIIILGINASTQNLIQYNPAISKLKAYNTDQIFNYKDTHTLLRLSPNITNEISKLKNLLRN